MCSSPTTPPWTSAKMTRVCDLVRDGLPYVATHPDFNCPTETGFAPDIGAIIAFIEASAGRRPDIILGKPYRGIVEEALQVTGLCQGKPCDGWATACIRILQRA